MQSRCGLCWNYITLTKKTSPLLGYSALFLLSIMSMTDGVCTDLLIPMSLMADDGGPTKITPSRSQRSANSVFSERKPYPG